ncbi:hypothetical protein [Clostridium sp.]|uniref:hypothetical protein n=1 Tax=Clostridium sp. TaxID=1506 RepID=UPI0026124CEC
MSTWLFIDCFLLILIIWWIYNLLKGEFLIDKLGAKASFRWLIGVLIITIIVMLITFPLVKNTYEIKSFIRDSRLSKYISSYKLSGFRNSTVIAKGNKNFEQLDNDLKFEYMDSVRKNIISIVSSNYGIGDGGYIEIHEMISDMKVEVDVGKDKYITKGSDLKLNGEILYKNDLSLSFGGIGVDGEKNLEYVPIYFYIMVFNNLDEDFIENISFDPIVNEELEKNICKKEGIISRDHLKNNLDSNLNPKESSEYEYCIIFKKNGFTEDEIVKLAKKTKFNVSYVKCNGNDKKFQQKQWSLE